MTAQPPNTNRRAGISVAVMVAIVAIGIGSVAACSSQPEPPPPPDEDAYVDALFTTPKFDWMIPKRPFIEQGYEACELLRAGHTEEQAGLIMWERDTSTAGVPEKVRERHLEQTVAAHKHLCPGA